MTDEQKIARAMSIVEAAVQDMADEGLNPMHRAVALAFHMNAQVDLAIPTKPEAQMFKASLTAD